MRVSYETRLKRVVTYIHDNPAGDMSLDRLADVAAMSRFHFHRIYTSMMGETVAQATRRIRMHRAAHWLVQSDLSIVEIARRCGHPNVQSFSHIFQSSFNQSPGAFRKRGDLRAQLPLTDTKDHPVFAVEIITLPNRRVAAVAHTGPYMEIGRAYETLAAAIGSHDLWPQTRGMVAFFHNDISDRPDAELRSHAGLFMSKTAKLPNSLIDMRFDAGRYAVLHYRGPYAGLRAAYGFLYGYWLPQSGEEPRKNPPVEIYLNSPQDTQPDDLLTDICLPIN